MVTNGHLGYDTNDFSVWWQQIGTTEYVWLAVADSSDIKIRQGAVTGGVNTDITWDTGVATILDDADGRCTSYSKPYISLDIPASGNPHVWVTARCFDGTNYVIEARDTSSTAEADPSTWTYNSANQITNDQSASSNVYANIVPLGSDDMYATFTLNADIKGCKWLDSTSSWKNSAESAACSTPVWDSGSEGTVLTACMQRNHCEDIDFAGTPLVLDGSQYYWKIRFWDDEPPSGTAGAFSDCTDNFTMLSVADQTRHGKYFFNAQTKSAFSW